MKNKLLLTLLAILCVICCVFAFVACDPNTPGPGDTGDTDDKGDTTDNTDTAVVTAAKWTEALTALPTTKNYTLTSNYTMGGEDVSTIIKLDGDKFHVLASSENVEGLLAKEGEAYYIYDKNRETGEWDKKLYPENYYNMTIAVYTGALPLLTNALKDKHSSATYADGKYTIATLGEIENVGAIKDVTITFKNGAVVSAELTAVVTNRGGEGDSQSTIDVLYAIKDVGTTSISLPNVPDKSATTKMTEDEWENCLERFADARNFNLTLTANGSTVGFVKLDGSTYYDKGGDFERIYCVDDEGDFYYFEKKSATAKWTKEDSDSEEYYETVNENALMLVQGGAQALAAAYSQFTFANGKYTLANLEVTDGFTLKNIEVTVSYGAVTKIVCTQVGAGAKPDTLVTIEKIGLTTIDMPTDFIDNTTPNGPDTPGPDKPIVQESNKWYMVVQSENGWVPTPKFVVEIKDNGLCIVDGEECKYTLDGGVAEIIGAKFTYYAVIDGNIMWLFDEKENTKDVHKAIQHFYNALEIDKLDYEKMVEVFGNGIMGGKPDQSSDLAGKLYVLTSFRTSGEVSDEAMQEISPMIGELRINFIDDVNARLISGDNKMDCTYAVKDNTVVLTNPNADDSIELTIEDEALIMPLSEAKDNGVTSWKICGVLTIQSGNNDKVMDVAGKTYVFADAAGKNVSDSDIASTRAYNEGCTIVFSDDTDTVTITIPSQSVVETGTYTQDGETVDLLITATTTLDGTPVDMPPGGAPMTGTLDGDKYIMEIPVSNDGIILAIFVLQDAE